MAACDPGCGECEVEELEAGLFDLVESGELTLELRNGLLAFRPTARFSRADLDLADSERPATKRHGIAQIA